uniref:Catalase n=1 Tax=Steinernema glaseri TaxID=37863 RepID=A0A1I7Z820_9BILA
MIAQDRDYHATGNGNSTLSDTTGESDTTPVGRFHENRAELHAGRGNYTEQTREDVTGIMQGKHECARATVGASF